MHPKVLLIGGSRMNQTDEAQLIHDDNEVVGMSFTVVVELTRAESYHEWLQSDSQRHHGRIVADW